MLRWRLDLSDVYLLSPCEMAGDLAKPLPD